MTFLCDVIQDGSIRSSFIKRAEGLGIFMNQAKKRNVKTGKLQNTYYTTRKQFEELKKNYHLKKTIDDKDFEFVLQCLEDKIKD